MRGSRPGSACSTSPPGPATSRSAPRRPGARVVASDLTPEQLRGGPPRGPRRAGSTSSGSRPTPRRCRSPTTSSTSSPPSFGAIFAPDHRAVADEMLRRRAGPGGTIGMINFTPEGLVGGLLRRRSRRTCPHRRPARVARTVGSEAHVRELFGDRVAALEMTRWRLRGASGRPRATTASSSSQTFGPVVGDSTRPSPTIPSGSRRSIATSSTSRRARTGAARRSGGVPLRVPARRGAARGCLVAGGLAQQRSRRLLEDLAPGAGALLLGREVLDDLAHAGGRDLDAVALADLAQVPVVL